MDSLKIIVDLLFVNCWINMTMNLSMLQSVIVMCFTYLKIMYCSWKYIYWYNINVLLLQSTEIFWKQMVLVKSLSNLRSPNSFEALLPYVLGQKACDTTVRLVALESLASWKAPRDYSDKVNNRLIFLLIIFASVYIQLFITLRSLTVCWNIELDELTQYKFLQITLILLELFENPAEDATVRSRALGFLVSWPLSSTIWSRLAFSTHRPLLQDLAGFTYSLIESVSKFKHPEALRE